MRVGNKSLIFGIHQVFIHPIVVYRAWKHLYGRPNFKEFVCIVVHDWGYIGKPNLDGKEGTIHPELGAKIAKKMFGNKYYELCICHSRHYARLLGKEPSKLCWADKLSFAYEPKWLYLFRARLSGEIKELRASAHKEGFMDIHKSDSEWYDLVITFVEEMAKTKTSGAFMHPEEDSKQVMKGE